MSKEFITILACPLCAQKLHKMGSRLACNNNHSFDYAKEGYIHLLPPQLKKTKFPGDNKLMIQSRRQFLDNHYYDFLIPSLLTYVDQQVSSLEQTVFLDSGCGEGFFTDKIQSLNNKLSCYGMDISKEAVRLAAKRNKNIQWFVASTNELPVNDKSIDIVLKINAPINYANLQKKLSQNAIVISVSPGENHLCKLRELLYLTPQPHKKEETPDNFTLLHNTCLEQIIQISNNRDIQNLFKMTPYYWNASDKIRSVIEKLESLNTPAVFNINIYQQSNNNI